jgi:hypothetical protein
MPRMITGPPRTANAQAPPLLLPGGARRLDSHTNLLVALVEVLDNLLALLLNLHNGRFLLHNQGVHVLEELGKLNHLLLNLNQGIVAILYGAEGGTGTSLAIALHEGLAEDLVVARVLDGLADLLLGGIGADDAVLAGHLVLGTLAELRLDLLVLLDGLLEATVDTADLRLVLGRVGVAVGLDGANSLGQGAVESHGLRGEVVELTVGIARRRGVGVVESALLNHAELLEVALNLVDATIDVAALVEDGVGVGAHGVGVLCQRSHLDIVAL